MAKKNRPEVLSDALGEVVSSVLCAGFVEPSLESALQNVREPSDCELPTQKYHSDNYWCSHEFRDGFNELV